MNFLLDVHLPISPSKFLDKQPDCTSIHLNQILQRWNTPDKDICRYADDNDLVVVTKDDDFKNSHFINKTPKKLIRITLGNISNSELVLIFGKYLPFILSIGRQKNSYIEVDREQLIVID
jgi:predicted nuclease of predicted toxin-antitoxin system